MKIKVTCPIIYSKGRETTVLPAGLEFDIDADSGQDWIAKGWAFEIPQAESVIDEPPAPPVEVEKPRRKRKVNK
jgi:hypothetical protein